MSTWTRNDEPSVDDYLRERAILLEMLVEVIPSGPNACGRWGISWSS
jgi:hypothetical protein